MTVLNAIVAKQLRQFKADVDALVDQKDMKRDDAIFNVLRDYIKASTKIRFEGDGYSDNWVKEAQKRGLNNVKTTPQALKFFLDKHVEHLFEELNILSKRELHARYEIMQEDYYKRVQIESRVLGDIAGNHIVPTAIRYQNMLIDNVRGLKEVLPGETWKKVAREQLEMIEEISMRISTILEAKDAMIEARKQWNKEENAEKRSIGYCEEVLPFFDKIRYHADKLELLVEDELWPLPKYRELMFIK
jgi:glutamine synthetase